MVLAYHVIISAYGFWLPNDPRGSWSDCIRKWELFRYGPATKVNTPESVAYAPHDHDLRLEAKESLDYPPVLFTPNQIEAIAQGFRIYIDKSGVTFWALAILDDHIHAVYMRHRYKSEKVNNLFKGELTKALLDAGLHPFEDRVAKGDRPPPCFGRKWWTVYIDNEDHLRQAIAYVEANPEKEGKPRQTWDLIVPYPLTLAEFRDRSR